MKLEVILPFVSGAHSVLGAILGSVPEKGELTLLQKPATASQVNVLCGVTGPVAGYLMYGMSLQTADSIASHMTGEAIKIFDPLAASAICELGNMISGHGVAGLHDAGFVCNISPPLLIRGMQVSVEHLTIPSIVVPLITSFGTVFITVGLIETNPSKEAISSEDDSKVADAA